MPWITVLVLATSAAGTADPVETFGRPLGLTLLDSRLELCSVHSRRLFAVPPGRSRRLRALHFGVHDAGAIRCYGRALRSAPGRRSRTRQSGRRGTAPRHEPRGGQRPCSVEAPPNKALKVTGLLSPRSARKPPSLAPCSAGDLLNLIGTRQRRRLMKRSLILVLAFLLGEGLTALTQSSRDAVAVDPTTTT